MILILIWILWKKTIQSELLKSEYRECEGELYDGYPAAKFCYLLNKLYPLPENAFLYVNDNNQLVYNTMNQGYTSDGILGSFFYTDNHQQSLELLFQ